MASTFESAMNLGAYVPAIEVRKTAYNQIYRENCDRIYSLAFWMTDNEMTAEDLSANTFLRAFAGSDQPTGEQIDRAFLKEVRELTSVGVLTLNVSALSTVSRVQGNLKRVHLERAVVQLPTTERLIFLLHDVEGYQHERIARLLGINDQESKNGLHQARIQVRNLVAAM
jgi:RNA polymerase sigma-70 factor, ECF subfamily